MKTNLGQDMLYLNECGVLCALGDSHSKIKAKLLAQAQSGIAMTDAWSPGPVGVTTLVTTQLKSSVAE